MARQVALFYGCKYRTLEKAQAGTLRDNFEFVKVYQSPCRGKSVLLKYKKGDLEPQRGASERSQRTLQLHERSRVLCLLHRIQPQKAEANPTPR